MSYLTDFMEFQLLWKCNRLLQWYNFFFQSVRTTSLKLYWFVINCKWSLLFLNAFDLRLASKERDCVCILCNLFSSADDEWMNDYKYRALVECQNIKVLKILKITGYIIYCPFNCSAWCLLLENNSITWRMLMQLCDVLCQQH
jgi:hypothetical protein